MNNDKLRLFFDKIVIDIYDGISPNSPPPDIECLANGFRGVIRLNIETAISYYGILNMRPLNFDDSIDFIITSQKNRVAKNFAEEMDGVYDASWKSFIDEAEKCDVNINEFTWDAMIRFIRNHDIDMLEDFLREKLKKVKKQENLVFIILDLTVEESTMLNIKVIFFNRPPDNVPACSDEAEDEGRPVIEDVLCEAAGSLEYLAEKVKNVAAGIQP